MWQLKGNVSEGTDEIWICITRRSDIFDPSGLVPEQQQQDKIITGNKKKRHQATLNDTIQSLSNCSVTERLLGDLREGDNIRTVGGSEDLLFEQDLLKSLRGRVVEVTEVAV